LDGPGYRKLSGTEIFLFPGGLNWLLFPKTGFGQSQPGPGPSKERAPGFWTFRGNGPDGRGTEWVGIELVRIRLDGLLGIGAVLLDLAWALHSGAELVQAGAQGIRAKGIGNSDLGARLTQVPGPLGLGLWTPGVFRGGPPGDTVNGGVRFPRAHPRGPG